MGRMKIGYTVTRPFLVTHNIIAKIPEKPTGAGSLWEPAKEKFSVRRWPHHTAVVLCVGTGKVERSMGTELGTFQKPQLESGHITCPPSADVYWAFL